MIKYIYFRINKLFTQIKKKYLFYLFNILNINKNHDNKLNFNYLI